MVPLLGSNREMRYSRAKAYPSTGSVQVDANHRSLRLTKSLAGWRSLLHDKRVQDLVAEFLLGHYKSIRRLGEGGMGVVYEAEDQKLGRRVAVKVLPESTREDPSALERFWREARAASALNHPGICTIYELNESGDSPFIVMELLEGSSLEKLYRGQPLPLPRLLEIGVQLADALDAAHRKGRSE